MNILSDIKFAKSEQGQVNAVIITFFWSSKKSASFDGDQLTEKNEWKLKTEIFSPYAVRGLSLFKRGVTIRTDILKFNPLKLHMIKSTVKETQIKKIAHLAELAGLSGLHVINHFDKLEPLQENQQNE